MAVFVDDDDGIISKQRARRQLALIGVGGGNKMRSVGVAGSQLLVSDAVEDALGCSTHRLAAS